MTTDECLEVVRDCARGGDVSPTQLRAAIYMLERLERGKDKSDDDGADLYAVSNVRSLRSA